MKNKKTMVAIISIVALLLLLIGITYAYWLVTKVQTSNNIISSACLDIMLDNESNDINLTSQYPMSDEDGMKLTPYTFTVTNNCNTSVDYQIVLESIGDESSAVSSSALKVALDDKADLLSNKATVATTISGAYRAHRLGYGTLAATGSDSSSATHSVRIWIDENAPISEMNKTFQSKISVTIGQGIVNYKSLAETIIENAEENSYLYTTTPDFDTATAVGEYGLYRAQDDLGTSYYFRGNPDNYVQFGSYASGSKITSYDNINGPLEIIATDETPMYWRIVRINGDGTIRLVYDGIKNGVENIGLTKYNEYSDESKYVGYTYDTSETDKTQIDSTIKTFVESWYSEHLEAKYNSYIADGIFCNDRTVSGEYYASYTRLITNKIPVLTCTNESDRYTMSETLGNGYLSKPIGLLTADEINFAGGRFLISGEPSSNYLETSSSFFTMSPSTVVGALIWEVGESNVTWGVSSTTEDSARPVINLRADVEFTGDGSYETPYVIKTY